MCVCVCVCVRVLVLRGYLCCSMCPLSSLVLIAGSAGQVITGNHETYLISADSAELADSWVAAIRRVLHEVIHHSAKFHLCSVGDVLSLQPYGGGMFGRSLEETLQVEARLGGGFVPVLIHRCVKYIREHGRLL